MIINNMNNVKFFVDYQTIWRAAICSYAIL